MLELSVKIRSQLGRQTDKVRKQGFIPAVLYGQKVKNLNLSVNINDFEKIYQEAGESTLIKLKTDDVHEKKERVVLIHSVDRDAVTDRFTHIDFNQIKMDQVIIVEVPLIFIGESDAVKSQGGTLIKSIQDVEIEALPQNLIHEIKVDISTLETFDDNIYIKDLKIPETVKLTADPEEVIVSVIPPRTEEELGELEVTPTEELPVEDVEVEKKGKDKVEVEEEQSKGEDEQKE
ncbi:50S ribosomal protein L25 [Patescibacteria group bacterium]|nr:50S ribosomal protein L25 [Patescibacteria group bacterium]MBU1563775.1 50S ribosomal protein L25 [Patescibacteria group bacterium]